MTGKVGIIRISERIHSVKERNCQWLDDRFTSTARVQTCHFYSTSSTFARVVAKDACAAFCGCDGGGAGVRDGRWLEKKSFRHSVPPTESLLPSNRDE
jgi:hypothetical protein